MASVPFSPPASAVAGEIQSFGSASYSPTAVIDLVPLVQEMLDSSAGNLIGLVWEPDSGTVGRTRRYESRRGLSDTVPGIRGAVLTFDWSIPSPITTNRVTHGGLDVQPAVASSGVDVSPAVTSSGIDVQPAVTTSGMDVVPEDFDA